MSTPFVFSFLKGLLFMIPEAAILAACIYYFAKRRSIDSILLSIGSMVSLCVMAFYNILIPVLQSAGSFDFVYSSFIFTLVSIISFAGHVSFAVGLFMLIMQHIKMRREGQNQGFH